MLSSWFARLWPNAHKEDSDQEEEEDLVVFEESRDDFQFKIENLKVICLS